MRHPVLVRAGVAAGALALSAAAFDAPAGAATALRCTATVSPTNPTRNSTVTIGVHTSANAAITTAAHYKTTTTTHTGRADSHGAAAIAYKIGRATPGYRVSVSVAVTLGSQRGSCATAFTPR